MGSDGSNASKKSNYLSRLALTPERRRHQRRSCSFIAKLVHTKNGGLRGFTCEDVMIVDISEGGARLVTPQAETLPAHFYLYCGGFDYAIGCSVVGTSQDVIRVEFLKEQPSDLIDYLSRERQAGEMDDVKHFNPCVIHH